MILRSSLLILLLLSCGDNADPSDFFDEVFKVDGLSEPAQVYFDAYGVLHATCATNDDCFFIQGYFHARDRFTQMDIRRRFGRARLSELAGGAILEQDKESALLLSTRDGESLAAQLWAGADEQTKAMITAYTAGVNAWISDVRNGRHGAVRSAEYDFDVIDKERLDDWEVLDTAACILPLLASLTNSSAREIEMGLLLANMPEAMVQDLYGLRPSHPSTVTSVQTQRAKAAPAPFRDYSSALMTEGLATVEALAARGSDAGIGSNNWAVGPSKSKGGALLANDPHLGLTNAPVWYLNHLFAKSEEDALSVAGASFVGLPGVLIGHNGRIAWGATTTYFDQTDVYVETLTAAEDGVMFNGQEVPFIKRIREFELPGGGVDTVEQLYVPHHGPVISMDTTNGKALTLRWTAQDADTDLNFIHGLNTAHSVVEAKQALTSITSGGQNWVIADVEGHIGWFPYNRLPKRPWAQTIAPWAPLPGDGSAEWDGWVALEDVPQLQDPPAGYISTANGDMTGALADGDPTNDGQDAMQNYVAEGYRQGRIQELLDATAEHDPESMHALQADTYSLLAKSTLPSILAAVNKEGLSGTSLLVYEALEDWDYTCPTGLEGTSPDAPAATATSSAVGCTAFHSLWERLRINVFSDDTQPFVDSEFSPPVAKHGALVFALTSEQVLSQNYWQDPKSEVIEQAMAQTGQQMVGLFNDKPWLWGRVHTLTLTADLFDAAGVSTFNEGPYANDGGLFTVDVANPERPASGLFRHTRGASIRWVCHLPEEVSCTFQLPGGQRHIRSSEFYNNLIGRWLVNKPTRLMTDFNEIVETSFLSIYMTSK